MYRGASYADIMCYQRCIDLWRRALQIRIDKDTMLYTDTCFTAQALVRLMIDYNIRSNINKEDNVRQRFHDIVSTFRLITTDIVRKYNWYPKKYLLYTLSVKNLFICHTFCIILF